jgi:hypothetical protein
MAAFPGLTANPARLAARSESVERYCLLNWWERRLDGTICSTHWPNVTAIQFDELFGYLAVILFRVSEMGCYSYGYAAARNLESSHKHAMLELMRHESVICEWLTSDGPQLQDIFERRALFFSTEEGHRLFKDRLNAKASRGRLVPEVICDAEIKGDWSNYATVWRCLLRPPSSEFLSSDVRFFFW